MDKNKKIILIGGIIEAAILIFALVVSILVWTTANSAADHPELTAEQLKQLNIDQNGAFIGFFQNNPTLFLVIICFPIFAIVALDFVYFAIIASKRESSLSEEQLKAIKAKAEEEVRKEMLDEILKEDSEEKKK